MKKYSFFSLNTQFENLGDALINREMVNLASENTITHVDLSRCPKNFRKSLSLDKNVIEHKSTLSLFITMIYKSLFSSDGCYYFLSPGCYFGEITLVSFLRKMINFSVLSILSFFFKVKIVHVGVSYERLGKNFLSFLKMRSKILHAHYVRDTLSAELAIKSNFKLTGTFPDLAFNLFDTNLEKENTSKIKKLCCSFRADQYKNQYDDVLFCLKDITKKFKNIDEIALFSQVERDEFTMSRLKKDLSLYAACQIKLQSEFININKCLNFYKSCDVVISNRLHVILMALSVNTPVITCISNEHGEKIRGIMRDLKMESDLINIQDNQIKITDVNEFLCTQTKMVELNNNIGKLKNEFASIFS